MSDITKETETGDYPSSGYAWYVVILLTCAYILSYLDRWVMSLLVELIKADLGLSDTELGLMGGLAFALFYTGRGIPVAMLADRFSGLIDRAPSWEDI